MANNILIGTTAESSLKLNESASQNGKIVLEGVFCEIGVLNRNARIYPEDVYLKHLQYLRDDIKNGIAVLGELDHPDRFETSLKEASHRVTDLWYDNTKKQVMGKIELLNTPNGKIAQELLRDGVPLCISSRAAGSVGQNHIVDIQQLYTYDLVAKPGFEKAVLHQVNESANPKVYNNTTINFLKESEVKNSKNTALQYGILNENISVNEIKGNAVIRDEAKKINESKININEMSKQILLKKDDISKDKVEDNLIIDVKGVFSDKAEEKETDDAIKSIKLKPDGEDKSDKKESTDECDGKKAIKETDSDDAKILADKKESLEKSKSEISSKLDQLLAGLKKEKLVKESTISRYPFLVNLNEANYSQFINLNESQKTKVANYINSNCEYITPDNINEAWKNGLNELKETPVWLKYASNEYKALYESASPVEKQNLALCAQYIVFNNKEDVNTFWENSGLLDRANQRRLNESFVNNMPKIAAPKKQEELPYSDAFMKQMADLACEYND